MLLEQVGEYPDYIKVSKYYVIYKFATINYYLFLYHQMLTRIQEYILQPGKQELCLMWGFYSRRCRRLPLILTHQA